MLSVLRNLSFWRKDVTNDTLICFILHKCEVPQLMDGVEMHLRSFWSKLIRDYTSSWDIRYQWIELPFPIKRVISETTQRKHGNSKGSFCSELVTVILLTNQCGCLCHEYAPSLWRWIINISPTSIACRVYSSLCPASKSLDQEDRKSFSVFPLVPEENATKNVSKHVWK